MLNTGFIPSFDGSTDSVMIVLHGLGDSMEGYRWLPSALGLPWLNYLLVDAPDEYYGGYSWYAFPGDPEPGIRRSRGELERLLAVVGTRGFRPEQTFLFGFSQGCLMTLEVAVRYPHRLAGCVGVSGYVHDLPGLVAGMSPVAREQRFLVTHGTEDPLIPIAKVREQMRQLTSSGLRLEWREFPKVHTIDGGEELGVIRGFVTSCAASWRGVS